MAVPFFLDDNDVNRNPILQMMYFERLLKEMITLLRLSGWNPPGWSPPERNNQAPLPVPRANAQTLMAVQMHRFNPMLDPRAGRSPNPVQRQNMPDLVASSLVPPARQNNAAAEAGAAAAAAAAAAAPRNGAAATAAPAPVQQNANVAGAPARNHALTSEQKFVLVHNAIVRAFRAGRITAQDVATVHAAAETADAAITRAANDAAAHAAGVFMARAANSAAARAANAPAARATNDPVVSAAANAPVNHATNDPVVRAANAPVRHTANAPASHAATSSPVVRAANAPVRHTANAPATHAANGSPVVRAANAPGTRAANTPVVRAANTPGALSLHVELCAYCYLRGNNRKFTVIGVTNLESTAEAATAEHHQHQNSVVPVLVDGDFNHRLYMACRNLPHILPENHLAEHRHDHSRETAAGYGLVVAKNFARTLLNNRSLIKSSILTAVFVVVGLKMFDRR